MQPEKKRKKRKKNGKSLLEKWHTLGTSKTA